MKKRDQQSPRQAVECHPIGVAETPLETLGDAPRQGRNAEIDGTLVLDPEYTDGLAGFDPGDRLDVVWFAESADRETLKVNDGCRGVFRSRSQDRPNPICVTQCEIVEIAGNRLRVQGVDMLDGTPILDLKYPLNPDV